MKPPVSFVTPFIAQGSIADFFRRPENNGRSGAFLPIWALDIATGLRHLHEYQCVHCDIAARNVFIDEHDRAVLGDLGLARPLDETDGKAVLETPGPLPAFSLASPQGLASNVYSKASDVFQYGLTLFDIASECKHTSLSLFSWKKTSASMHDLMAQMAEVAKNGYKELLERLPPTMPVDSPMVQLMLRCLAFDAAKRPTAAEIVEEQPRLLKS